MAQKNHRKSKHKEVETPSPLCVDSTGPRAERSASTTGQPRVSRAGSSSCKKSPPANQIDAVAPTKWPARNATQEDVTHVPVLLKERTEERLLKITPLRPRHPSWQRSVPENRRTQKRSRKPTNKVLPVNNLAFSPPNLSPRTNPKGGCHVSRDQKAPNGENPEQNVFTFGKRSAARRTGVDTGANLDSTSKYHKPHLFSNRSVPLLNKNQFQYLCLPHLRQRTNELFTVRNANNSQVFLLT